MGRLLEGEPAVLALLRNNPFPDDPPRLIRSTLYSYEFSDPDSEGWWVRRKLGRFCPAVTLDGDRLRTVDLPE